MSFGMNEIRSKRVALPYPRVALVYDAAPQRDNVRSRIKNIWAYALTEWAEEHVQDGLGLCDAIRGVDEDPLTLPGIAEVLDNIRLVNGIERSAGIDQPSVNPKSPAADVAGLRRGHCEATR